jgi:hypothetical protein
MFQRGYRRWRLWRPFPQDRPILERLLGSAAAGAAGGVIAAVALIAANVGGIRSLILGERGDLTAAFLLVWGMAGLFGFISLGISIMNLGDWHDRPPDDLPD